MSNIKDTLNLFCLSIKVFFVLTVLIVFYYYNSYGIWSTFYFITALIILLVNMTFYLKNKFLCRKTALIISDFLLIFLGFLFGTGLVDLFPPLLLLILYAFTYFKASLILLIVSIISLMIKTYYGFFSQKDLIPAVFFSLGFYISSTRWDIFMLLRHKKLDNLSLKAKYQKLQRDLALFSKKSKWFEEYEAVINKLSKLKAKEDTEIILKNLLGVESVKILPIKLKHTESFYGNVVVDLDDIIVLIKPKGKYLLRDKDFKTKMEVLFKLLKPYLESFLANKR